MTKKNCGFKMIGVVFLKNVADYKRFKDYEGEKLC